MPTTARRFASISAASNASGSRPLTSGSRRVKTGSKIIISLLERIGLDGRKYLHAPAIQHPKKTSVRIKSFIKKITL